MYRSFRYDVAGAMTNQNLDSDARILFLCVGVVNKGTCNSVGQLVRMGGVYFLIHICLSFPRTE